MSGKKRGKKAVQDPPPFTPVPKASPSKITLPPAARRRAARELDLTVPLGPFDPLDVPATFLTLVSHTCPDEATERERFHAALTARGWTVDAHGNLWFSQGESRTLFTAHLDDASFVHESVSPEVDLDQRGNLIASTSKADVLGGDAKAGMAVMLFLIARGVPGHYVLFSQEESGRIGSEAFALEHTTLPYDRCVSFDRRGEHDVITHQCGVRTCSEAFALALCDALLLSHAPSDGGSYTDSYSLRGLIPECTNVAVGYEGAHGPQESQNLTYLSVLADACAEVDWEALPTERVPVKTVYTKPPLPPIRRPEYVLQEAVDDGQTRRAVDEYAIEKSMWHHPRYYAQFIAAVCTLEPELAGEIERLIRPPASPTPLSAPLPPAPVDLKPELIQATRALDHRLDRLLKE